jgi:carbon-monoxide dehydrogenase small subunit
MPSAQREARLRRIEVEVDGRTHSHDVEPRQLLVHYLRETLGSSGVLVGCDTSTCGSCTVLVDGRSVLSCTLLAAQADGARVETVASLATEEGWHPLQQAFHETHGLQCGFCTPGMLMAAAGLLAENPRPTEAEIREGLEGNLCRCTGYEGIVDAVALAAQRMDGDA